MSNTHVITQDNKKRIVLSINSLPLYKLQPFNKHPFKPQSEEKMQELAESIADRGVIVPILVRPIGNEKYEIVSGHNRVEASKLTGLETIPCEIREMDDNTATVVMVDSNLQRETILPSEKAWAYRYKLEALKSQGRRTDLTLSQAATKLRNDTKISSQHNESRDTLYRYIRLTHLIPKLLEKVDEKKLAFIPAVELSYLKKQEQKWLYSNLEREEYYGIPIALARKLKGISQNGKLTYEKIDKIIVEKNHEPPRAIKVPYKAIRDFFPPDTTPKEFERTIQDALIEYFKSHPQKHMGKKINNREMKLEKRAF